MVFIGISIRIFKAKVKMDIRFHSGLHITSSHPFHGAANLDIGGNFQTQEHHK